MKKILFSSAIIAAMMFTGCGTSNKSISLPKKAMQCQIEGANAPLWVCSGGENMTGGVFAVASAQKTPLGINFQRQEAMAAARDEIARQISLKVKNMFKSYMSSTGVGNAQTAERVATSVSKQLSYQVLQGSKLLKTWISPKGTMFVLVGMKKSIKKALKEATKTTFKNNQALWQEFKAKKAQEELDAEINKEFK